MTAVPPSGSQAPSRSRGDPKGTGFPTAVRRHGLRAQHTALTSCPWRRKVSTGPWIRQSVTVTVARILRAYREVIDIGTRRRPTRGLRCGLRLTDTSDQAHPVIVAVTTTTATIAITITTTTTIMTTTIATAEAAPTACPTSHASVETHRAGTSSTSWISQAAR
jgi:hypothetical protein